MAGSFTPAGIEAQVKGFGQYLSNLNKMDSAQQKLGKGASTIGGSYTKLGSSMLGVFGGAINLTVQGIGKITQGLLAFGASVVEEGSAYTKEMSNVAALTQATGKEFDALSKSAEELGRTTKFTATEAAEGMSFLAMAGFEVNDIIGAMPGVLDLASAANMELGRSADIVSNVLSGFGANTDETQRFVDVLAKTAASANTDVEQLGQAMKFVAPVAASMGLSVEETAAALGTLGDAGIQAGIAGRGLRGLLSKLASPTEKAQAALGELGVEVFDNEGKMKSLADIVGEFTKATAGMTDEQRAAALGAIFSRGEISPLLVLMNKGQQGIAKFTDELGTASDDFDGMGFAAGVAAKQMDNLSGDVTLFKSALSGVKISLFKALEPLLRKVVQAGTALISKFGQPLADLLENTLIPTIQKFINTFVGMFRESRAEGESFIQAIGSGLKEALTGLLPKDLGLAFVDLINAFEELSSKIVGVFLPATDGASMSIKSLLDSGLRILTDTVIPSLTSAIQFVTENFDAFKGAIIGVGVALAGAAIVAAIVGIVAAFNPLTLAIAGIIAVAAALGAAWATNFLGIRDITNQVWAVIKAVFDQIVAIFTGTVLPQLQMAFDNITMALSSMGISWGDIWSALGQATVIVAAIIGGIIVTIIGIIASLVAAVASMVAAATAHWSALAQATMTIFEGISQFLVGFWEVVQGIFSLNIEQILSGFELMGTGLSNIVLGMADLISTQFQIMFDAITTGVSTFIESIIGFFQGLYDTLVGGSIVPDLINSIISWFTENLAGPILAALQALADSVSDIFQGIFSIFTGGPRLELDFSKVIDTLTKTLPDALTGFTEMVQRAFTMMSDLAMVYAEFLAQTLAQETMRILTNATRRMATDASNQFSNLIGIVSSLDDLLIIISSVSMPAITTAARAMEQSFSISIDGINSSIDSMVDKMGTVPAAIEALKNSADQNLPAIANKFSDVSGSVSKVEASIGDAKSAMGALEGAVKSTTDAFKEMEAAAKSAADAAASSTDSGPTTKAPLLTSAAAPPVFAPPPVVPALSGPGAATTISIGPVYITDQMSLAEFTTRVQRAVTRGLRQ